MRLVPCKLLFTVGFLLFFYSNVTAQIKVACVGNSITAGSRLDGAPTYPQRLQDLLGSAYTVANFGLSGVTATKGSSNSLWDNEYQIFENSLAWEPDIVIIKLGTNDAKTRSGYFKDGVITEEKFYKDYKELIALYKSLPSNPVIYICYPIPVFQNQYDISTFHMKNYIIPVIKKLARETDAHLVDLYSPFIGREDDLIYKPHDPADKIHPNGAGAEFLAQEVYKLMLIHNF